MTMNWKKVFISFNHRLFLAPAIVRAIFIQEFDQSRTFLLNKKSSVCEDDSALLQKFFTKQSFVDVLPIKPHGQVHIRRFPVLRHGAPPPLSFVQCTPAKKRSCRFSSARPPERPVLPDRPRSAHPPYIRYGSASGRLP